MILQITLRTKYASSYTQKTTDEYEKLDWNFNWYFSELYYC